MISQTTPRDNEDFGEEVLSKAVKAGRRTYFFDVKATRGGDYFLTITESRKKTASDGSCSFDRHKIFLYKEDFSKFCGGLEEVIDFIRQSKPEFFEQKAPRNHEQQPAESTSEECPGNRS